jgi:allantoinase
MVEHDGFGARLRIHSRRVATPDGVLDATVEVAHGRIASVTAGGPASAPGAQVVDLGELWLLPGLVDTHVHINEPGRAEWEGFATATRAAAAGGITTVVDMPLNSIPATCNAEALAAKVAATRECCSADVAFWGGVVPGNAGALEALAAAGVRGFKCFLSPSGVAEFQHVGELDLRAAMPVIAKLGLPLLVHAELPKVLDKAAASAAVQNGDPSAYKTWLASRPPEAEVEAIKLMIQLCRETRCRVHIVHLSATEALPALKTARAQGLPITVETCPHYLVFDAEGIARGRTEFKCAPPIRSRANREALWAALTAGEIDLIATDHSPCPGWMKVPAEGDFMQAWGGIASLEMALSAMWAEASVRRIELTDVVRWMSAAPAKLAGLDSRKGAIAVGHDADLVAFDADDMWLVDANELYQRHAVTPYAGRTMRGRVMQTWLRGQRVHAADPVGGMVEGDEEADAAPPGECLLDATRVAR